MVVAAKVLREVRSPLEWIEPATPKTGKKPLG